MSCWSLNCAITHALMEHQRDDSITMRFTQSHHACCKYACTHALTSIPSRFWTISSHFSFRILCPLVFVLASLANRFHLQVLMRPNNKQQQCSMAFHPTTRITLPMRICTACIPLSCLPLLVMLLFETHVALLIKDKQCIEINPK